MNSGSQSFKSFHRVTNWFYHFTQAGGVSQARAEDNRVFRSLWMLLYFIGLGLTVLLVLNLFGDFMENAVNTSVTVVREPHLEYPSITICNKNKIHCTRLFKQINICEKNSSDCSGPIDVYCKLFVLTNCPFSLFQESFSRKGKSKADPKFTKVCKTFQLPRPNKTISEDRFAIYDFEPLYLAPEFNNYQERINYFMDLYMQLTPAQMMLIAHKPKRFIVWCTVADYPSPACVDYTETGGTPVISPMRGLCYSLNLFDADNGTSNPNRERLYAWYAGTEVGIDIILNIEAGNYMGNGLTMDQGITVTVDDNRITPNLLSNSINIQPGTSTNIQLTVKEMYRKAAPYTSQCISKYPDELGLQEVQEEIEKQLRKDGILKLPKYSLPRCISRCFIIQFDKHCGCVWPMLVQGISNLKLFSLVKFCNMTSPINNQCMLKFFATSFMKSMTACQQYCKPECDTKVYSYSISSTKWPSQKYAPMVAEYVGMKFDGEKVTYEGHARKVIESRNESDAFEVHQNLNDVVSKNFMMVRVHFGSMEVMKVVESPKYSYGDFVNSLGGCLSIFLGISMVMVFEGIELLIRFFGCFLSNITSK